MSQNEGGVIGTDESWAYGNGLRVGKEARDGGFEMRGHYT